MHTAIFSIIEFANHVNAVAFISSVFMKLIFAELFSLSKQIKLLNTVEYDTYFKLFWSVFLSLQKNVFNKLCVLFWHFTTSDIIQRIYVYVCGVRQQPNQPNSMHNLNWNKAAHETLTIASLLLIQTFEQHILENRMLAANRKHYVAYVCEEGDGGWRKKTASAYQTYLTISYFIDFKLIIVPSIHTPCILSAIMLMICK